MTSNHILELQVQGYALGNTQEILVDRIGQEATPHPTIWSMNLSSPRGRGRGTCWACMTMGTWLLPRAVTVWGHGGVMEESLTPSWGENQKGFLEKEISKLRSVIQPGAEGGCFGPGVLRGVGPVSLPP